MKPATLTRATFKTSRLLDFCSLKELSKQIGHSTDYWPLVILKELTDNAIEEANAAPVIRIEVGGGKVIIADEGPGIPAEIVADILDFSVRVSSREAYVSPTRGAQGNALKTIVAMAFALDGIIKQVFVWHDLLDAVLLELLLDKGQRADAYCLAARNHAAKKIIARELKKLNGAAAVKPPSNLSTQVRQYLNSSASTLG